MRLLCGVKNIPHPNKAHYGGEDAYFVLDAGGGALGIADGVGGWHDSGVNPADYSKTFMATARQYLEECARWGCGQECCVSFVCRGWELRGRRGASGA